VTRILVSGAPRTRRRAGAVSAFGLLAAGIALAVIGRQGTVSTARAQPPAGGVTGKGPVGWQTLRRLDLLPRFRFGVSTRQFSSYDPGGSNDDGLSGAHSCLRQNRAEGCVLAEHAGPGEIDSLWFTRNRGVVTRTGRLRIELDGRRVVDAPLQRVVDGALGAPFAFPLVANRTQTSGGVYIKVPMPFRSSMRVSTQFNPHYHHVTYRTFADAEAVPSFDRSERAPDVLAALRASGLRDPKPPAPGAASTRRGFAVAPGRTAVLARVTGSGALTALRIRLLRLTGARPGQPPPRAELLRSARLRISFDGRRTVDSPLGEFFGSGVAPATVRALLIAQSPAPAGYLSAWWPMPYLRSAEVSLANLSGTGVLAAEVLVTRAPAPELVAALAAGRAGRFHATSRRALTVPGRDWTVLAARGRGTLVGITHSMRGPRTRRYLEGDERVVVDGRVQMRGTGTEDFYEGGWYFIAGPFTRPFNGNPVHRVGGPVCPASDCTGAYRLLIGDAIGFSSSVRFSFEHGHRNLVRGLYGTTAYWYG
jgi:hypothetical protein